MHCHLSTRPCYFPVHSALCSRFTSNHMMALFMRAWCSRFSTWVNLLSQITRRIKCMRAIPDLIICVAVKCITYCRIVSVNIHSDISWIFLPKSPRVALKVVMFVDEENVILLILTHLVANHVLQHLWTFWIWFPWQYVVQICTHILFLCNMTCVFIKMLISFLLL